LEALNQAEDLAAGWLFESSAVWRGFRRAICACGGVSASSRSVAAAGRLTEKL